MLEQSFALLYFLKQSKTGGSKKYIYLRITFDGHPVEVSTKKQWWENRWDQNNGRANGTKPDAQELNFFLGTLENKVFHARKKLIKDDELITAEALRALVTGKDTRKMILEVFADHNRQMEALVGKDYADGTLERYDNN